ncbi:hypothetical protein LTR66_012087, partial [Elasticomyces elasticus]
MADAEDEREEELSSITAIFPELVIDSTNPFAASIGLPVVPSEPLSVAFAAPESAPVPAPANGTNNAAPQGNEASLLSHLPPLRLHVILPEGYPTEKAPVVELSTSPEWLPLTKSVELREECRKLWEEYGHGQTIFAYIDFLQQSAERGFDVAVDKPLDLPYDLKAPLLAYDRKAKRAAFEAETFECPFCMEPKKGSICYKIERCGHVFCVECLQDYYNNCIKEGDVTSVKCMALDCGKNSTMPNNMKRKRKTPKTLHPRELLAIPLEEATVRRYVDLKRKKAIEADKSTVYCPRTWCQGAARSNKYPPAPITSLADYPESSSESEAEDESPQGPQSHKARSAASAQNDRLAICSLCTFAFCCVCHASWHGDIQRCWPRDPSELSVEEKASYDYIRLNTSPCPTCASPTQKTYGCNHMKCFQCNSHFCYLCGAWLNASNPYAHFNNPKSGCHMRLFELEEGDEGLGQGAEGGFAGARGWEAFAAQLQQDEFEAAEPAVFEARPRAPNVPPAAPDPPRPPREERLVVAMAQVRL